MTDGKRMHWAAVVIMVLSGLKSFIIPIIIAFFIGGTGFPGLFALIIIPAILLISGGYSFLYWFMYRYRVEDRELHIRQGVLIKKQRYIQRSRVQSFDMSAGLLQRPFGLVKVKIETAGGGSEPDVELIALDRSEANRLKKKLLKKPQEEMVDEEVQTDEKALYEEPHTDEELVDQELDEVGEDWVEEEPEEKWVLGTKRLIVAGMTSGGVGLVLSAVVALVSQIDFLLPEQFYESTIGIALSLTMTLIAVIVVSIAIIAWVISIGITVIKYGQFQVEKRGTDIIVSRGLLERKQLTLKEHRITAVRMVSSILRQPFGYTTLYVESKGGGSAEEQQSTMLIPLIKRSEVEDVLAQFLPEFSFEEEYTLSRLPKRAKFRYMIRSVFPLLFVIVPIVYFFQPVGWYSLLLIIPGMLVGHWRHKHGGFYHDDQFVIMQWRLFNLNRVLIPKRRIQAADVVQSPIQRWRTLSTFSVSILSSLSGKSFEVYDLGEEDGRTLLAWFSKHHTQLDSNEKEDEPL